MSWCKDDSSVLLKNGCVRRAAIVGTPPLQASVDRIDSRTDSTTSQRITVSMKGPENPQCSTKSKDVQYLQLWLHNTELIKSTRIR